MAQQQLLGMGTNHLAGAHSPSSVPRLSPGVLGGPEEQRPEEEQQRTFPPLHFIST